MNERLKVISVDVTYNCNFRCRHCYNSSGEHCFGNKELTDEEMIELMKDIAGYSPDSVCICGGETLLRKELLYEIGNVLKDSGCQYNLVTNGYLMTDEIAKNLKNSGYTLVQVSIDGLKDNYEWLRRIKGGYEKAIEAIKCLKKAGLLVAVSCVPFSKNLQDIPFIIELCEQLGVNSLRMQPLMQLGRAEEMESSMVIQDGYERVIDIMQKYRIILRKKSSPMNLEWGDPVEHLLAIAEDAPSLSSIHVSAYGEILISPYIPLSIGSLKEHSFKDYMKKNILGNYNTEFIRKLVSLVKDEQSLNIHKTESKIPAIFTGDNLQLEFMDSNYYEKSKELYAKFFS